MKWTVFFPVLIDGSSQKFATLELRSPLRQGAAEDMRKDPSGMVYKILEWNPEKKPTHLWKGTSDDVHIRKTYCQAVRSFVQWPNHVFREGCYFSERHNCSYHYKLLDAHS